MIILARRGHYQVMIILNDNLLEFPNVTEAKLSNGDRVMLAIVILGG